MHLNINHENVLHELVARLEQYDAAPISNDIASLDAMFWKSEQVVRFGVGKNRYTARGSASGAIARADLFLRFAES